MVIGVAFSSKLRTRSVGLGVPSVYTKAFSPGGGSTKKKLSLVSQSLGVYLFVEVAASGEVAVTVVVVVGMVVGMVAVVVVVVVELMVKIKRWVRAGACSAW